MFSKASTPSVPEADLLRAIPTCVRVSLACAWVVMVGCSDDGVTVADDGDPGGGDALSGAAYLASTWVYSPDGVQRYTARVSEPGQLGDAAFRGGLESPGTVTPFDGAAYSTGGNTAPTVTRFTFDGAGRFSEGLTLSFAALGVTSAAFPFFVAPDKAYLYDTANPRLIGWNPSAMELNDTVIDLTPVFADTLAQGWRPEALLGNAIQRGNRLFVPARWESEEGTFRPSAGLLVIDTETDSVVSLLEDERIADSIFATMSQAGDIYLATGFNGVREHWSYGTAAPGGLIRVRNGEESFDPSFYIHLDQAVGDRPATKPFGVDETSVYVRACHPEERGITFSAETVIAAPQQIWRYWRVNLESGQGELIEELPWTAFRGSGAFAMADGRLFVAAYGEDTFDTQLFERTDAGFVLTASHTGELNNLAALGPSASSGASN
jgi:hypothetical protein